MFLSLSLSLSLTQKLAYRDVETACTPVVKVGFNSKFQEAEEADVKGPAQKSIAHSARENPDLQDLRDSHRQSQPTRTNSAPKPSTTSRPDGRCPGREGGNSPSNPKNASHCQARGASDWIARR